MEFQLTTNNYEQILMHLYKHLGLEGHLYIQWAKARVYSQYSAGQV